MTGSKPDADRRQTATAAEIEALRTDLETIREVLYSLIVYSDLPQHTRHELLARLSRYAKD